MIDMHTHTTFSDGTYTPSELIDLAHKTGLKAIAITDHDTIDGIKFATQRAKDLNIELIQGIEFSCGYNSIEIHILGYFLDITNKPFLCLLDSLKKTRDKRNKELIQKLQSIGLKICLDDVACLCGGNLITKAHFAKALVQKGYAKTKKDAFNIYLGKNKPAYISRDLIDCKEAIKYIKNAGGKAVLAHPYIYKLSEKELDGLIKNLKENNIDGIECYYPSNTIKQTNHLLNLAKKYNLKITAGSDFHGANREEVTLGNIFLQNKVDYAILQNFKN